MARPTTTTKAGEAPAPCCGRLVIWRKSAGEHIKFNCGHCDLTGFATSGGDHYKKVMQHIAGDSVKESEKAPPAPAVKKPAFSIGDL